MLLIDRSEAFQQPPSLGRACAFSELKVYQCTSATLQEAQMRQELDPPAVHAACTVVSDH